MNRARRVGLPWASLTAFVRIVTNPRALREPLSPGAAWQYVEEWIDAPASGIPEPGPGHRRILGRLLTALDLRADLAADAVLASLCIEHGVDVVNADSDVARFTEIGWINPVAGVR